MELGFYLKKVISYFLEPFGMLLILFFIGIYYLFSNKSSHSKFYISLSFVLLLLFSYPPFSNFLIQNLENKYPKYDYKSDIKYIHVLGSGHNDDVTQPLTSQVGRASIKRDLEGIIIHLNSKNSKIIFTGYAGTTNITTAKMNAKLALALGVDVKNIIVNGDPKDTREEAVFTKSIIANEAFVLVTSASHMPRSMMIFQSLGLNPIPAPTDFYKDKDSTYFEAPSIDSFKVSQVAIHEYIGILWVKLKSFLRTPL